MSSNTSARDLINSNFLVVPIPRGEKGPTRNGWQNLRISENLVDDFFREDDNVGILTGGGLVCVDLDSPETLALADRFLPETRCSGKESTPKAHRLYRAPIEKKRAYKDKNPGEHNACLLEVLAEGQQFVAPPSIHPETGQRYVWSGAEEIAEINADALDEGCGELASAALILRHLPPEGGRYDFALALCGYLLTRLEGERVERILLSTVDLADYSSDHKKKEAVKGIKSCVSSTTKRLEAGENVVGGPTLEGITPGLTKSLKAVWGFSSKTPADDYEAEMRAPRSLTDLGNSRRLLDMHGSGILYCYPWKKWMTWDGVKWSDDDSGQLERMSKSVVRSMYREAADTSSEDYRKALVKHAQATEAVARCQAMITHARSEVPVLPSEMDAEARILNCQNGVLDLSGGYLMEHDRSRRATKATSGSYREDARGELWEGFLARILPHEGVRRYMQQLCGLAVSGEISEHVLPILYGKGQNGKSTFLEAARWALGDYGISASKDLLMMKKDAHPTELAQLFGARMVTCVETEGGKNLNESLVKQLTGGDKITARRMREDFWEFYPTWTVLLATNHKPNVRDNSEATWRRLRLIPFTETIPESEKDPYLLDKLKEHEVEAILAWMVEGWNMIREQGGIVTADEVVKATEEYKSETDSLAAFLDEHTEDDKRSYIIKKTLYEKYKEWCAENGERQESQKMLSLRLHDRGYRETQIAQKGPDRGKRAWLGLRLREPGAGPEPDDDLPDFGNQANNLESNEQHEPDRNNESPNRNRVSHPQEINQLNSSRIESIRNTVLHPVTPTKPGEDAYSEEYEHKQGSGALQSTGPEEDKHTAGLLREPPSSLRGSIIALDLETTGLDPRTDRARLLSLGDGESTYVVDLFDHDVDLPRLLSGKTLVIHNAIFDLSFLYHGYGYLHDGAIIDTMIASRLLYAGTGEKHSLDAVLKRELGLEADKTHQKSDWSRELTSAQIEYAAEDVRHLSALKDALEHKVSREDLKVALEIEHGAIRAQVRWGGAPVDVEGWRGRLEDEKRRCYELVEEMDDLSGGHINWGSTKQVLQRLRECGASLNNTNEESLKAAQSKAPELIGKLLEYRGYSKLVSTYGEEWLRNVRDGRVYSNWRMLGTAAGRMTASSPNLQQLPGARKDLISAPAGRVLVEADYSQLQLRIAALLSEEENMLSAFRNGEDLHTKTAREVFGKQEIEKRERQIAKSLNFGLLFGMQAKGLRSYLAKNGIEVSLEEAVYYRNAFFRAYPGLAKWHSHTESLWDRGERKTRTPMGRARYRVSSHRELLNTPIQGAEADGLKIALYILDGRLPEGVYVVMAVHDSITVECDQEQTEEVCGVLFEAMKEGMGAAIGDAGIVEVEA